MITFTINITADLKQLTDRLDAIDQKLADQAVQIADVKQDVGHVLSNQAEQKVVLDRIDANTVETLQLAHFIANQFPISLNITGTDPVEQP